MEIAEIDKKAGTPCPNLCAAGCGVYETKPAECSSFKCMWLHEKLHFRFKPDAIGLLFFYHIAKFGPCVICIEMREGAAEQGDGEAAMTQVMKEHTVILCRFDGKRTIRTNNHQHLAQIERITRRINA
jgi:hypothetical protein